MTDDRYLVWSNEHRAWWGPRRRGYVQAAEHAGRYSLREALTICAAAIPGTAQRLGMQLPDLPVREAIAVDVELALRYRAAANAHPSNLRRLAKLAAKVAVADKGSA